MEGADVEELELEHNKELVTNELLELYKEQRFVMGGGDRGCPLF